MEIKGRIGSKPIKIGGLVLYSVFDLEQMLGVQATTIRQYLRTGRIRGRKLGGRWFVSEDALREFFLQEDEAVKRQG